MKKLFILLILMVTQAIAFGQIKEISAGITPYGHWRVREKNEDLSSRTYSITKPAFNFGLGFRTDKFETLVDVYYAKEAARNNHFAAHVNQGITLLQGKRVQIPIYIGLGLSYYSSPVPTKLIVDFGGRFRVRVYITNTIAWYAGGYYLFGLTNKKDNKSVIHHSGLETGLMYNF